MRYAEVIGDPVAYSKSPVIHGFWLSVLGIEADYRATRVTVEGLGEYFSERRNDPDWLGCNITMPLKTAAMGFVDAFSDEVVEIGAANTVYVAGDALVARNTDLDGVLAALPHGYLDPGNEVCIIGSGGAARAALAACKRRSIGIVLMSCRNVDVGFELMDQFGFGGISLPIDDPHNIQTAEVIINATPLGMTGKSPMPQALLEHLGDALDNTAVLDMVYSPVETDFLKAAAAGGCRVVSGLEMLIGQAAAAFELFFGAAPPRDRDEELRALLTS